MHQQPCVVVSLASTSLTWSDLPAPRLCPLQLLLLDCIRFSCYSPIASASAHCSPTASSSAASTKYKKYKGRTSLLPRTSHFCYRQTDTHLNLDLSRGNHTPVSRSYSHFMDTWTHSVRIHQLVFKPRSKAAYVTNVDSSSWLT